MIIHPQEIKAGTASPSLAPFSPNILLIFIIPPPLLPTRLLVSPAVPSTGASQACEQMTCKLDGRFCLQVSEMKVQPINDIQSIAVPSNRSQQQTQTSYRRAQPSSTLAPLLCVRKDQIYKSNPMKLTAQGPSIRPKLKRVLTVAVRKAFTVQCLAQSLDCPTDRSLTPQISPKATLKAKLSSPVYHQSNIK